MSLLGRLKQHRRKTASALLMWLLFSGQLFCTVHAGFGVEAGVEPNTEQQVMTCCHGGSKAAQQSRLDTSCCDNPATFCCGEGKQGTADTAELPEPTVLAVCFADTQQPVLASSFVPLPLWVEQFHLRRSDPPIYLLNCTFLD